MTYKQFKTAIRKLIGCVGVGEFVDNSVEFNSEKSWNTLFANSKFLKSYVQSGRLSFYDEVVHEVLQRIDLKEGQLIDIGCGTGHLLKVFSEKFPTINLVGADFSEAGLTVAKTVVPAAEFYTHDIYNLNLSWKESFDLVICTEVLEHLLYPDKALKNLLSYVKPKGSLVLCVPNGRIDTYSGHIQFWSPESWTVFIEQHKGELIQSYECILIEKGNTNLAILNK